MGGPAHGLPLPPLSVITLVIFPLYATPPTIVDVGENTMKNLLLTFVFALVLVPASLAQSQTQLLCNNCTDGGQTDTTNWIVMAIAG